MTIGEELKFYKNLNSSLRTLLEGKWVHGSPQLTDEEKDYAINLISLTAERIGCIQFKIMGE